MKRSLENAAQARAHVLAHAVSAAAPWQPPPFRPWAVNAWQVPVLPVGLYVQGSPGRVGQAFDEAGFEASAPVDLTRVTSGFGLERVVSSAARFFDSVVRLSPVSPGRAIFQSMLPAVHWLGGRTQRSTWIRDNADGSRHVVRLYDAGSHGGQPLSAVTIARYTGLVIRSAGGTGWVPELDKRYDLVRDELLDIFAPAALEQFELGEPWDLETARRLVYRVVLAS